MLHIYYGNYQGPDLISDPARCFDKVYKDSWITDPMAVRLIRDIDGSEVKGLHRIESRFLGTISPLQLSYDAKALLLLINDDTHIINLSDCGDYCAEWILKIADNKDIRICLWRMMPFKRKPFDIEILNTGRTVHTMIELYQEAAQKELL